MWNVRGNLVGKLGQAFFSGASDITHTYPEFGEQDVHSLYLNRERHTCR